MVLLGGKGGHALSEVAVGFRVAVLEGQLLQLLFDGVQPQQPSQRRKDLRARHIDETQWTMCNARQDVHLQPHLLKHMF